MPITTKYFCSAALLFAFGLSFAVQAEEPPYALPDLAYVPGEGHFVTDTEVSFERIQGFQSSDARVDAYLVSQSLRYGLIGGLEVGVSESCAGMGERSTGYFSGDIRDYQRSCGSPSFSALYRLISQTDLEAFPVNVDLAGSYVPDIAKPSVTGLSLGTGGESGDVSLTLSRAYEELSLLARAGAGLYGKTKVTGLPGYDGFEQGTTAYARPYAEVQAQYKLGGLLFLSAGLRGYTSYDTDQYQTFPNGGASFTSVTHIRSGASYQPEIGAAWLAVPDLLAVSLSYRHSFDGKERFSFPGFPDFGGETSSSSDAVFLDIRVRWF